MSVQEDFGTFLRQRRRALGLAQRDFPGINHVSVSQWEKGRCKPSKENQLILAQVLNVDPTEIALRLLGQEIPRTTPAPTSRYAKQALEALEAGNHNAAFDLACRYARDAAAGGDLYAAASFLDRVARSLSFEQTMTLAFEYLSPNLLRRIFSHAVHDGLPILTTLINKYLMDHDTTDPVDHARYLRNHARDLRRLGHLEEAIGAFEAALTASRPHLTAQSIILLELELAEVMMLLRIPTPLEERWRRAQTDSFWNWSMWTSIVAEQAWARSDWDALSTALDAARSTFNSDWNVALYATIAGPTARLAIEEGDPIPYTHLRTLVSTPDLDAKVGAEVYDMLLRQQLAIAIETQQPEASLLWANAVTYYKWRHIDGWAARIANHPPAVVRWDDIPAPMIAVLSEYGFRPAMDHGPIQIAINESTARV